MDMSTEKTGASCGNKSTTEARRHGEQRRGRRLPQIYADEQRIRKAENLEPLKTRRNTKVNMKRVGTGELPALLHPAGSPLAGFAFVFLGALFG
jgi:hypothetical protein